jgi:hypothetical protein
MLMLSPFDAAQFGHRSTWRAAELHGWAFIDE